MIQLSAKSCKTRWVLGISCFRSSAASFGRSVNPFFRQLNVTLSSFKALGFAFFTCATPGSLIVSLVSIPDIGSEQRINRFLMKISAAASAFSLAVITANNNRVRVDVVVSKQFYQSCQITEELFDKTLIVFMMGENILDISVFLGNPKSSSNS